MLRPVGEEVVRVTGDQVSVEILPSVGARVHRLVAFGRDVVRTPATAAEHRRDPFFWGGYVMAPWCNRAPAGPLRLGSRIVDLEPNFPDGTAIHGLVHDRPWVRQGDATWRIEVPAGRWPWHHSVHVGYSVVESTLVVDLSVVNHDDAAMPAGVGWHPWFRSPVAVTIPAALVFESNLDSTAEAVAVADRYERHRSGALPAGIDATWTALDPRRVRLEWPDLGVRATIGMSDSVGFVVAAAPDDVAAVAVEQQTHGPDGIRRLVDGQPGAPTWLAPGATLAARIEVAFRVP